ncbi:MAG: PAS domain-containing protein [Candidatus Methanoplasma sp.]|jgi:transcriptional regulator with PAS, ATPase and Fis domain|nr:PAS domain-containing protein [Candidatus Methanoplasma sp.]
MAAEDVSADNLLNMILDEVDDMIVINDSNRNVIWINRAAQCGLGISVEEAVGSKCYKLFGATCYCDRCTANHTMGGPSRCGSKFICRDRSGEYECEPVSRYEGGKLKIVVQHIRYRQK